MINRLKLISWFLLMVKDPTRVDRLISSGNRLRDPSPYEPQIAHARASSPEVARLFDERYLDRDPDLEAFSKLPEGSLGRVYARHMLANGIEPKFYPDIPVTDDASYMILRCRQTHDILHVLLDASTSLEDEVHVQGFVFAQTHARIAPIALAIAIVHCFLFRPLAVPTIIERFAGGLEIGRRSSPFLSYRWDAKWGEPIERIRAEMGMRPA